MSPNLHILKEDLSGQQHEGQYTEAWEELMDIEYLREFIKLAEERNFSRAARSLFISQSTLSKHIAALEEELGVDVVNHALHGFELTEMGTYVLDEFKRIVSIYDAVRLRAREVAEGVSGSIALGIPYYATRKLAGPIVKEFSKTYPNANVRIVSAQPDQLQLLLRRGELDATINMYIDGMSIPDAGDTDLVPLSRERQVLLCSPESDFAGQKSIKAADLSGHGLLSYQAGEHTAAYVAALKANLEKLGADVTWTDTVENVDLLTDAVLESGCGILVPKHTAVFHGELCTVDVSDAAPNQMLLFTSRQNGNPTISLFKGVAERFRHH